MHYLPCFPALRLSLQVLIIQQDWTPTVRTLIEAAPAVRAYPGYSGKILPQWVFGGRIVLTGDAAHPIGHAGFGAGMAIDDALALGLALDRIELSGARTKVGDLLYALDLFQRARLPLADRLGNFLSRLGEKKSTFGKCLSEEEIQRWVETREETSWIHEHDVDAAFQEALNDCGDEAGRGCTL